MASVKIEGLDQIVANLKALPAEIAGKNGGPIRQALAVAAKRIRDDAKQLCPENPAGVGGHLRDQIIMKRDPNPRAIDNAAERYIVTVKYKAKKYRNTASNRRKGRVGSTYQNFGDFYYWRFVEFGTSKMPAHSFLRASFEQNKDALPNLVRDALAAGVQKAVDKLTRT